MPSGATARNGGIFSWTSCWSEFDGRQRVAQEGGWKRGQNNTRETRDKSAKNKVFAAAAAPENLRELQVSHGFPG